MQQNNWHNLSTNKAFALLKSSLKGLSLDMVKKIRAKYGANKLPEKKSTPRLVVLLEQLHSPLVYVLVVAAIISLFLEHFTDAGVILFVVIVNTIFGYWQESKADKSIKKLREIVRLNAKIIREGDVVTVDATEIVPGDILLLSAGDMVAADARVVESEDLQTIEAPLTGESAPILKQTDILDVGVVLAERTNMLYMGTLISSGKGRAVVCATGANSEIGKITKLLDKAIEIKTPLQEKLASFSRTITFFILAVSVLIFIQGYFSGRNTIDMFMTVVALAVSAIPEGLLVAVTIILTIGMQYILRKKALVRKLVAAETLGSTSIICTDKTGTLTTGKMSVSKIITADKEFKIIKGSELEEAEKSKDLISKISVLCNNANVEHKKSELEKTIISGAPTEKALFLAAIHSGYDIEKLKRQYDLIEEIPFDSTRKYMATLHKHKAEKHDHVFVKGAPEKLFAMCDKVMIEGKKVTLSKQKLHELKKKYESLTAKGLRVLAFAYKTGHFTKLEGEMGELIFLGFAAIKDPLRNEAKETIQLCKKSGIRPIMITGDHRLTAKAIYEELGVKVNSNIVEGKELDKWSDEELVDKVIHIDIYARVEPRHKLRIVNAWQSRGEVVAMTGDGINDAPAIKAADIGIALGSGSDVTKETADIILLDNNFSVIVAAVEQGRVIFENIRKVIVYLLADSFSEMILIAGALLFNLPLPILATQILWINLIADGLPNIAMTLEPGEKEVMNEKPRHRNEPILNREMKVMIFVIGIITDLILLGLFVILLKQFNDIDYVRTIIFTALGIDSLLYVFSVRSFRHSIFTKNPFSNMYLVFAVLLSFASFFLVIYVPFLQTVFHTVALHFHDWLLIVGLAILKIILIEIVKHFYLVRKIDKNRK